MSTSAQPITIEVEAGVAVSGLVLAPPDAGACYVFAHGAGAGMAHAFMSTVAQGLAERGIATVRYQFPYMERGAKRTDAPATAHKAVRAAVTHAATLFPALPLFAGGKSFGARMTSQAQALAPLSGVQGLVFIGFPLHPDGAPSSERARHLADVKVPMLFLQGTRDKLAQFDRVQALVAQLGAVATLVPIEEADHSFHVLVRSGRNDGEVMQQLQGAAAGWMLR
jgi:predicted alpha/beta-hydrolase family hydrolase